MTAIGSMSSSITSPGDEFLHAIGLYFSEYGYTYEVFKHVIDARSELMMFHSKYHPAWFIEVIGDVATVFTASRLTSHRFNLIDPNAFDDIHRFMLGNAVLREFYDAPDR